MAVPKRINPLIGLKDLDVYVEDTEFDSAYFRVLECPSVLTQGKSSFLVGGSNFLKPGVDVKFEIVHDITNEVIYTEAVRGHLEGDLRRVSIEVYEDIIPGPATLYIVGELNPQTIDVEIPISWQNIYNVRWTKNVTINAAGINTQPIYFYKQPSINVSEIFRGYLVSDPPPTVTTYLTGSGDPRQGLSSIAPVQNVTSNGQQTTATYPEKDFADKANLAKIEENKPINKLTGKQGHIGKQGKLLQKSSPSPDDYLISVSSISPVSSSYIGHTFTINNPQVDSSKFQLDSYHTVPTVYTASVMKIIDETTFVPSSVFYINDTRTTPSTLVPAPLGNQYITASYQNLPNQNISANNFFSFADVELSDLRTFSGDVHKVKVYAKSEGSLGDFEKIYDSPIESSEILLDSSDLTLLGNMGYIQDLSRLNSYWEIYQGSDGNGGSGTLSYSSAYIVDSMKISGSNTQYDDVLRVQLKKDVSFVAGNTYTFRASLYGIKDSVQTINGTTINDGKFEIYVSGSAFNKDTTEGSQWGIKKLSVPDFPDGVGSYNFGTVEGDFIADNTGTGRIQFKVPSGQWYVSDVSVKASADTAFNPEYVRVVAPMPQLYARPDQVRFLVEFYDVNNNIADSVIFSDYFTFQGENVSIGGTDNILSGSMFISNATGSGIEMAGIGSGFIRSMGYKGFTSASSYPTSGSGFMMWSGSVLSDITSDYTQGGVGLELVGHSGSYFKFKTNPSELDIRTDKFFIGQESIQYMSGSDRNIEISSSLFWLDPKNDRLIIGADATINADLSVNNIFAPAGTNILTAKAAITSQGFAKFVSASIGAFKLNNDSLFSGPHNKPNFYISGSATGTDYFISSSNFQVRASGEVSASSLKLSGGDVGGLTVTEGQVAVGEILKLKDSGDITGSAVLLGDKSISQYLQYKNNSLVVRGDITVDSITTPATIGGAASTPANASASIDSSGNAIFKSGSIAGWKIIGNLLSGSNATLDADGAALYMSTKGPDTDSAAAFDQLRDEYYIDFTPADQGNTTNYYVKFGPNFMVDSDGILIASGAKFEGTITASAGSIGGASIESASLAYSPYWRISSSAATDDPVSFISSSQFKVSADGRITASAANIEGKITATSGKIANWDIIGDTLSSVNVSNKGILLDADASTPIIEIREDDNNRLQLYHTTSTNWGIIGRAGGTNLFRLGSTNQIAGWAISGSYISKAISGSVAHQDYTRVYMSSVNDNAKNITEGFSLYRKDEDTDNGATKIVRLGGLSDTTDLHANDDYGLQVIRQDTAGNYSNLLYIGSGSQTISGWNISTTGFTNTGIELSSTQASMSLGTNRAIILKGGTANPYISIGQSTIAYGEDGLLLAYIGTDPVVSFVGSGGYLKFNGSTIDIQTDTLKASGSNIILEAPRFFLGGQSQYVSGSNGNIEISSSNFHLTNAGDVTMAGTVTATAGEIGGFSISSDAIYSGTNFYLSGSSSGNNYFLSSSNFNIKASGDITGSQVLFSGGKVAGWDLSSTRITSPDGDMRLTSGNPKITIGTHTIGNGPGIQLGYDSGNTLTFFAGQSGTDYIKYTAGTGVDIKTAVFKLDTDNLDINSANGGSVALGTTPNTSISGTNKGIFMSGSGDFLLYGSATNYFKFDATATAIDIKSDTFDLATTTMILDSGVNSGKIALGNTPPTSVAYTANSGVYMDGTGDFLVRGDASNYIKMYSNTIDIKSEVFDLDAGTLLLSSATNGGKIALGGTPPTAYNSGVGVYLDGTGKALIGNSTGSMVQFDGATLIMSASKFYLGGSSQYVSGSNGNIEISSSNFYLDNSGNVTMAGTITATAGAIGGSTITSDALAYSPYWRISASNATSDPVSFISSSAFKVSAGGNITGSSVNFTGGKIAGFTIATTGITSTGIGVHPTGQTYAFTAGGSNEFNVKHSGQITGSNVKFTGGQIGGWEIDSDEIKSSVVTMSSATQRIEVSDGSGNTRVRIGEVDTTAASKYGLVIFDGSGTAYSDEIVHLGDARNQIASWSLSTSQISSNNLILDSSGIIQTSDFASGVKGWRITSANNGEAEFEKVTIRGTLATTVFEKESVSAVGGQLYVANSTIISQSTQLAASDTTMSVANVGGFTGSYNNNNGEVISIKKVTDTGFTTEYVLIQSASRDNPSSDKDLRGKLYVVRGYSGSTPADSSSLGDAAQSAQTYENGQVIVSTGRVNTGYIRLNANPNDTTTPYIDIVERTGSAIYDVSLKARLGDLSGLSSGLLYGNTSPGFGLFTENVFLQGAITATTGSFTGIVHIRTDASNQIKMGTNVNGNADGFSLNNNNFWYTTGDFRVGGASSNYFYISGSTIDIKTDTLVASGSSIQLKTPNFYFGDSSNYISGSGGKVAIVNTGTTTISGSAVNIQTPKFYFGNSQNFISGSNDNIKIQSYGTTTLSGSEVTIETPSFFFGKKSTQFVSGSNGYVEISSSKFHIQADGDVIANNITASNISMSGVVNASEGGIGGWVIGSNKIYTGTNETVSGYTSANGRLILSSSGAIHAKGFYVTKGGNASFSGSISSSEGNIAGWTIDADEIKSPGSTVVLDSDSSNGQIKLGSATALNTGDGIYMDGGGNFRAGDANGKRIQWDGTNITVSASDFFFGDNSNYISGSGGNLAIQNTGTTTISGSAVNIQTPKFFMGGSSQYVSGSNGNIEISSSNFHLSSSGDVTMAGTITATEGAIGGSTITSDALAYSPYWRISSSADTSDPVSFISSSAFKVSAGGNITGSSVLFDGGKVGGWTITENQLEANNIKINAASGYIEAGELSNVNDIDDTSVGFFANKDGEVLIKAGTSANKNYMQFKNGTLDINSDKVHISGSQITLKTPDFYFGDSSNYISGSGGNLAIVNTGTTTISGSAVTIETPRFFLGQKSTQYISGSLGNVEISSSKFHLQADGDVIANNITASNISMSGVVNSSAGTIGGWKILPGVLKSPGENVILSASNGGYISLGATPPITASSGVGIFLSGSGDLLVGDSGGNKIQYDASVGSINMKSRTFNLDATTIVVDSATNNGKMALGGTPPTSVASTVTGSYLDGFGNVLFRQSADDYLKFTNRKLDMHAKSFFLGGASQYVSGSGGNLKIYSTGDTTLSGSSVTVETPKFFLGKQGSQYVSGSNNLLEISSSKFHLKNDGSVTMTGNVTATTGEIGGYVISSTAMSASSGGVIITTNANADIYQGGGAYLDNVPYMYAENAIFGDWDNYFRVFDGRMYAGKGIQTQGIWLDANDTTLKLGADNPKLMTYTSKTGIFLSGSGHFRVGSPTGSRVSFDTTNLIISTSNFDVIGGAVTASAGSIADWTITTSSLESNTDDLRGLKLKPGDRVVGYGPTAHTKQTISGSFSFGVLPTPPGEGGGIAW